MLYRAEPLAVGQHYHARVTRPERNNDKGEVQPDLQ